MSTKILLIAMCTFLLLGSTAAFAEQSVTQGQEGQTQAASFSDVPSGHWSETAIQWGVQNNIVSGYEDGMFKPNNSVTQEECLALVIRAFNPEHVEAEPAGRWSDPFYNLAKAKNYPISGQRDMKITRQSVAEIIAGVQGKNFTGDDAV